MELKYEIGYAVQNHVMSLLKLNQPFFQFRLRLFGPLTVVDRFLPVAVLHWIFPKKSVIIWGGWSTQGSGRYARIAGSRISNLQRAVARSIR